MESHSSANKTYPAYRHTHAHAHIYNVANPYLIPAIKFSQFSSLINGHCFAFLKPINVKYR